MTGLPRAYVWLRPDRTICIDYDSAGYQRDHHRLVLGDASVGEYPARGQRIELMAVSPAAAVQRVAGLLLAAYDELVVASERRIPPLAPGETLTAA